MEISSFSEFPYRSPGTGYIGGMKSFAGLISSKEYKHIKGRNYWLFSVSLLYLAQCCKYNSQELSMSNNNVSCLWIIEIVSW